MARAKVPRTEREEREHKARLAIGSGAGVLLVGFSVGCILSFVPVATGLRMNPPFDPNEIGWVVVFGSLIVSALGLALLVYGLVQMGRSRHVDDHAHAS